MKLNLGCGYKKMPGFVNVDSDSRAKPDLLWNLEQTPWPWEDGTIDHIVLTHTLEHLGETTEKYLSIWKEMWRVLCNGGVVEITVPHWRHDNFVHDPTHVRAITPIGVGMFDQERNMENLRINGAETKLGLQCGIDFSLAKIRYDLCDPWQSQMQNGQLSEDDILELMASRSNVCEQIAIMVAANKPCRYPNN
ncbi:MAG: methyltransferase domain-containing protein [bacterium]|nr:methyltransferase domain-containing protein [bacterium]